MKIDLNKLKEDLILILIAITTLLIFCRISDINIGANKSNSLSHDFFITKKLSENAHIEYNQLVTFRKHNKWYADKPFTKIIAGKHNDQIIIVGDKLLIKSKSNLQRIGTIKKTGLSGELLTPIKPQTIAKNHYFVYAPSKDSLDSRYQEIGLIAKDHIIGKSWGLSLIEALIYFSVVITVIIEIIELLRGSKPRMIVIKTMIIVAIFLFLSLASQAKDLGIQANTFPIAEKDLSQSIKTKLTNLQSTGQLEEIQQKWITKTKAKINRPTSVKGLTRAKITQERIHDPSIIVNNDIKDHMGRIIAKKGQIINPLHHKVLTQNIIFINADDQEQLDWSLSQRRQQKNPPIIILTQGNIMDIMKEKQIRLFFDQNGFLTDHFNIRKLPSLIYQKNDKLIIKEVAI